PMVYGKAKNALTGLRPSESGQFLLGAWSFYSAVYQRGWTSRWKPCPMAIDFLVHTRPTRRF
ncbi:MAG: hypothetical protein ACREKE_04780, partial [bacterium]